MNRTRLVHIRNLPIMSAWEWNWVGIQELMNVSTFLVSSVVQPITERKLFKKEQPYLFFCSCQPDPKGRNKERKENKIVIKIIFEVRSLWNYNLNVDYHYLYINNIMSYNDSDWLVYLYYENQEQYFAW